MTDKLVFARNPVGTGMYRAVSVDDAKGIVLKKNPDYKHGGDAKPPSNIGNMNIVFMPEIGTRIASFLAGNIDVIARQISIDQAEDLASTPGVKFDLIQGPSVAYMMLDARGRTGVKALTDVRVRRAMFMAVNRPELAKLQTGNHAMNRTPEGICFRDQKGCDYSIALPDYDPEGAKKLMAEAGYADGFEADMYTYAGSVSDYAVAVAGMLKKINIRANVVRVTVQTQRKFEADNKVSIMLGSWPNGQLPDVSGILGYFLEPALVSDYHGDPKVRSLAGEMDNTMDPVKRRAIGKALFDYVTEQAYVEPVGPRPSQIVYRDYLDIKPSLYMAAGFAPSQINWR
jgi:peptide/nickel transport system substrate-binding protein